MGKDILDEIEIELSEEDIKELERAPIVKREWNNILKHVYENGSADYNELIAKFASNVGITIEEAEGYMKTLFACKFLERKGDKVTLTKEGYEQIKSLKER